MVRRARPQQHQTNGGARSEDYVRCCRLRCAVSPSQNSQVALLVGDLSMQEVQAGYRRERRRVLRVQTSAAMSPFTLDVTIQLKW